MQQEVSLFGYKIRCFCSFAVGIFELSLRAYVKGRIAFGPPTYMENAHTCQEKTIRTFIQKDVLDHGQALADVD